MNSIFSYPFPGAAISHFIGSIPFMGKNVSHRLKPVCARLSGIWTAALQCMEALRDRLYSPLKERHRVTFESEGRLARPKKNPPQRRIVKVFDFPATVQVGKKHFSSSHALENSHQNLLRLFALHQQTGLQDTEQVMYHQTVLEIAKALWSEEGTFHQTLIPLIQSEWIEKEPLHHNRYLHLKHNLNQLAASKDLQQLLGNIGAPAPFPSPAACLIYATLNLPIGTPLTAKHAKQMATATLLSHPRQGDEGSCFATFIASERLFSHPVKAMQDFISLLTTNGIQRKIMGIEEHIPFLACVADEDLDRPMKIKGSLFNAPGIQAVCRVLGISNPQMMIQDLLQKKFRSLLKEGTLTPRVLIAALVEQQCGSLEIAWKTTAELAFSAQTHSLLLQGWSNAIAGLAEGGVDSCLKEGIRMSIQEGLTHYLQKKQLLPENQLKTFVDQVDLRLQQCLHLFYDPTVDNLSTSWNGHGSTGAFVLYDKIEENIYHWRRIDHSKTFQEWIYQQCTEVLQTMSLPLSPSFFSHFEGLIFSSEFLNFVLIRYHKKIQVGEMLAQKIEHLKYTPWLNKLGHDAFRLWQMDTESVTFPNIYPLKGKDAQELLVKLMEIGKHFPEKEKAFWKKHPYGFIPIRLLNRHAFHLIPFEGLMGAWNSSVPAKEWMETHIIKPGMEVANSLLPISTQHQMIQYALSKWVDPKKGSQFLQEVKSLPAKWTISHFRMFLLNVIQKVGVHPAVKLEELPLQLDTHLCKALPESLKKSLQNSVLSFADTNWHKGIHDIHFGFGINPGTGGLEIMEILDDKSHITILNQSFLQDTWEILC